MRLPDELPRYPTEVCFCQDQRMTRPLRIFISSPGDVPDERLRAGLVIDKLAQEFRRYFAFEVIRWEHEPLIASGHFQDALDPPSEADIVILILWSRLGAPLPEKTAVREYRGIDGRAPVTGTERLEHHDRHAAGRRRPGGCGPGQPGADDDEVSARGHKRPAGGRRVLPSHHYSPGGQRLGVRPRASAGSATDPPEQVILLCQITA